MELYRETAQRGFSSCWCASSKLGRRGQVPQGGAMWVQTWAASLAAAGFRAQPGVGMFASGWKIQQTAWCNNSNSEAAISNYFIATYINYVSAVLFCLRLVQGCLIAAAAAWTPAWGHWHRFKHFRLLIKCTAVQKFQGCLIAAKISGVFNCSKNFRGV